MEIVSISTEARSDYGKAAAARFRKEGKIPAIFYADGLEAKHLLLDEIQCKKVILGADASQLFKFESADSDINDRMALIKDLQIEPLLEKPLHIDFYEVIKGRKVVVKVPIDIIGESTPVKHGQAVLNQSMHELEVECLPKDIPSSVTLDMSQLTMENPLHVSDIELAEGIELKVSKDASVLSAVAKRGAESTEESSTEDAAGGEEASVAEGGDKAEAEKS